jgi:hypothetical protein
VLYSSHIWRRCRKKGSYQASHSSIRLSSASLRGYDEPQSSADSAPVGAGSKNSPTICGDINPISLRNFAQYP